MQTNIFSLKDYLVLKNITLYTEILNFKKKFFISSSDTFKVIYCSKGKGFISINNTLQKFKEQDFLLIYPDTEVTLHLESEIYFFQSEIITLDNDWFTGYLGLKNLTIYHSNKHFEIINILEDLCFFHSSHQKNNNLYITGLLFCFLSLISQNKISQTIDSEKKSKIYPAIIHMKTFYHENHSIEFYAKLCNMSTSRFKHLFTEETYIPPNLYLNSIRLERAKKLLTSTRMTINEIAYSVGFNDPHYFCRIFKKHTSFTPSEFARTLKKNQI